MHVVTFQSGDPTEHVQKVLGCLQRMNFDLADLSVMPLRRGTFEVRVTFSPTGTLSAETFVARVRQVHGVEGVESDKPATAEPQLRREAARAGPLGVWRLA